jgi:hypothetical protein
MFGILASFAQKGKGGVVSFLAALAFSQDMVNHRFFSKALDTLPKALEEGLL